MAEELLKAWVQLGSKTLTVSFSIQFGYLMRMHPVFAKVRNCSKLPCLEQRGAWNGKAVFSSSLTKVKWHQKGSETKSRDLERASVQRDAEREQVSIS